MMVNVQVPATFDHFSTTQELRCPRPAGPSELRFVEKHPVRFSKRSLLDAAEPDLEVLCPLSALEATQGQNDSFFSQLLCKCYLREIDLRFAPGIPPGRLPSFSFLFIGGWSDV